MNHVTIITTVQMLMVWNRRTEKNVTRVDFYNA